MFRILRRLGPIGVSVVCLALCAAFLAAFATRSHAARFSDRLNAFESELQLRSDALVGDLDKAQKKDKKLYDKGLKKLTKDTFALKDEIKLTKKVIPGIVKKKADDTTIGDLASGLLMAFNGDVSAHLSSVQDALDVFVAKKVKPESVQKTIDKGRALVQAAVDAEKVSSKFAKLFAAESQALKADKLMAKLQGSVNLAGVATLSALTIASGTLTPTFDGSKKNYDVTVGLSTGNVTVTPTATADGATIKVDGVTVASGQSSPSIALALGANAISIEVTSADATKQQTYTVTVNRLDITVQHAYVKASNPGAGDSFSIVAIDGDTMVVGAQTEDSSALGVGGDQANDDVRDSGAAYVFVRTNGQWTQQAYLKAPNSESFDRFGGALAISGDTIVVGAIGEDSNATGVDGNQSNNAAGSSGAAYVFVRNGTTWEFQAYLKASNTDSQDLYGASVAISGDTIVVGASTEKSRSAGIDGNESDDGGDNVGAAYVYVRSGTTWTQQAYLKQSNPGAVEDFGRKVAIDGNTIAISAYQEDSDATGVDGDQNNTNSPNSGAVYVFTRSATTWTQQAYIKASNDVARFGTDLSLHQNTLVVSAPEERSGSKGVNGNQNQGDVNSAGAAYAFFRVGTTWSQQAYLKASNTDESDSFGTSVAVFGDTIAVGASSEDSAASGVNGDESDDALRDSGAVYLFTRSGTTWSASDYIKASNPSESLRFGSKLAMSGTTIVVGTSQDDSSSAGVNGNQFDTGAENSGAIYVLGK